MAQTGFPWHAQSRGLEKAEAGPDESVAGPRPADIAPGDGGTEAKPSFVAQPRHTNSATKRRSGSTKGPPRVKPPLWTTPTTATESTPALGTSPLPVRTIPPWVGDADEDDLDDPQLPGAPHAAFVAEHHYDPAAARRPLLAGRHGADPRPFVTVAGAARPERTSRWVSFARASAYPRENFDGEKVDADYLDQHFTDYRTPWLAGRDDDDDEDGSSRYRAFRRKRQVWYKRAQFTILRNPFIPLAFRLVVFTFALVALGLGLAIYHGTGRIEECIHEHPRTPECLLLVGTGTVDYYRDPSGLMAVIVDAIALVYTMYITYDEYFSKPLGLRPARAKVRLVLLDLVFVVFQSANLALSFESLTVDEGACQVGSSPRTAGRFDRVCRRQKTLSGVLLISLTAWLLTFSVSVLRLVERIDTK